MRTIVAGAAKHRSTTIVLGIVVAVLCLGLPFIFPPFRNLQFTGVMISAIAVLGLNLLTGYNGQVSLGHSAFFGVGAYTTAVLVHAHHWNYLATIPIAAGITFIVGFLFGLPALRLEGLYLALVTLGLAIVAPPVFKRFGSITGGVGGINTSPPTAPAWTGLADDQFLYLLVLAVTVVMFLLAWNLVRGRTGRAMIAIRDNEIAAESAGVHPARIKTFTFAWSAMYAGVAGALYTVVYGYVSPDSFTIVLTISFIAAMVIGGVATISGAIFGALFIKFVPVYSDSINHALGGAIYGVALIVFMLVLPGGFVGLLRRTRNRLAGPGSANAGGTPMVTAASPFGKVGDEAWADDSGSGADPPAEKIPPGQQVH